MQSCTKIIVHAFDDEMQISQMFIVRPQEGGKLLRWFPPYPGHGKVTLAQNLCLGARPPRERLEIPSNVMKIPMPSHDPKMSDFGSQMPPKVSKMSPRSDAKLIKFRKMLKMRNLMKTSVFIMFLRVWDIRNE